MTGQTWTPAPRKGAIPLHPMQFGMILGRAFAGLRHNPKVLFGFAVVVQFVVGIITAGVMLLVGWFVALRIASVPPSSPDFGAIVAGSIALGGLAAIVMALVTVALTAVVQGLVAADVSYAALSRKASLRMLWSRVKPAFWRLFSYTLLQALAALLWTAIVFGIVFGVLALGGFDSTGSIVLSVIIGLVLLLGSIPLFLWLTTKLLVVPSVLVLEHATLGAALVRSWRLIRGRFWPALGIMVLINLIMGLAMQVVAFPVTIVSTMITGIVAPTGAEGPSEVIAIIAANVVPQVLLLAVQAIAIVVQGTGATLIYLDSRMRYEALDQTLIRHVELASHGTPDEQLGDPYAVDPARAVSKTPRPTTHPGYAPGYAPAGYPPAQHPAGQYPGAQYPAAQYPPAQYPPAPYPPAQHPPAQYPAGQYPPAPQNPQPAAPPSAAPSSAPGAADSWTAPGSNA
ncbi:hypothetical protein [Microbacterium sp. YJN-G]|uniref:hypothetical protein n=1 Tax=Microbacterium sp. YJN-G TaxID=2763257 RepID=UPI0018781A74|nr:hypothetical protein [Microbacterium sp. YJN-G]